MKRNSVKYIVCPICGSNLDFGEKCDCENKVTEPKADAAQKVKGKGRENGLQKTVGNKTMLLHN